MLANAKTELQYKNSSPIAYLDNNVTIAIN